MNELWEHPLVRLAAFWAFLHFVVLALMSGLIFLLAHVPPKAVNLDSLILATHWVYGVFYSPIAFLRWLWPGESSPWVLNVLLRAAGSALVGAVIAALVETGNRGARISGRERNAG